MKWLRRDKDQPSEPTEDVQCEHIRLLPKWDRPDDMGNDERASSFWCEACGTEFSAEDGARLRATEQERVKRKLAS